MPRLRFDTARDLFEAFPIAERLIEVEPSDEPSLQFLAGWSTRDDLDQAVGFCAFLLPRREAVWWGCRTVRALIPTRRRTRRRRSAGRRGLGPGAGGGTASRPPGSWHARHSGCRRPVSRWQPAGRAAASTWARARRSRPAVPDRARRAGCGPDRGVPRRHGEEAGDVAALPRGRHPARRRRNAGGLKPWGSRSRSRMRPACRMAVR